MIPREILAENERLRQLVEELEWELSMLKIAAQGEVANLMDYYSLTVSEAKIVRAMALAHGAPLDRCYLADVIGVDSEFIRHIDSHIKRIRAKTNTALPIDTIYGIGYRILPEMGAFVREVIAGKHKPQKKRTHFYREGVAA